MDRLKCITCRCNLRDTGKMSADFHTVYCINCGAEYETEPMLDELGYQKVDPYGRPQFWLNPISPGDETYSVDVDDEDPEQSSYRRSKEATDKLKAIIESSKTINEFLNNLKTL